MLEQRRLIYAALGKSTNDANEKVLKQFKYIAKLTSNVAAKKQGLTIYTYKWDNNNIVPNPKPLQYEPDSSIDWEDAKYPVDIKLWDGNNSPALGDNFYENYQFRKGKYTQTTIGLSLAVPGGPGRLVGYLKGFGYCEFACLNHSGKAISLDFGIEIGTGIIEGKYNYNLGGIPNPVNFAGLGSNISYSANELNGKIVIELSDWKGFKDDKKTWEGTSFGFEIEATIGIPIPGEQEDVKTYTEITFPKLHKKTYNKLNKRPYDITN